MRLVVFGLTLSSSWGNGHASLLRGLLQAFGRLGHTTTFFERDVPYYAQHRDLDHLPSVDVRLYSRWEDVVGDARAAIDAADVGMVTSYCGDGVAASDLLLSSRVPLRVFYDLDTPVTIESLRTGVVPPYIPPQGLGDFDLVLSFTGGAALVALKNELGARRVKPLYGSVDPDVYKRVQSVPAFSSQVSYLGTYADDRQEQLKSLFLEPARLLSDYRFVIGGSKYPGDFPWLPNIWFIDHVPPPQHAAFYSSSLLTLNITRRAMASMGHCPSGRLFEAAACGTVILSDYWQGLEDFFEPQREILIAANEKEATEAITLPVGELEMIARAARERILDTCTANHRALELQQLLEEAPITAVCLSQTPSAANADVSVATAEV